MLHFLHPLLNLKTVNICPTGKMSTGKAAEPFSWDILPVVYIIWTNYFYSHVKENVSSRSLESLGAVEDMSLWNPELIFKALEKLSNQGKSLHVYFRQPPAHCAGCVKLHAGVLKTLTVLHEEHEEQASSSGVSILFWE